MPFWRFTILTLIGCIPWVTGLALLGRAAGEDWERLQRQLHYVDYALILAGVAGLVWWLVRRRARRIASAP
jgi:membrane protein DedA with SNARE-associated domain